MWRQKHTARAIQTGKDGVVQRDEKGHWSDFLVKRNDGVVLKKQRENGTWVKVRSIVECGLVCVSQGRPSKKCVDKSTAPDGQKMGQRIKLGAQDDHIFGLGRRFGRTLFCVEPPDGVDWPR